MKIDETDYIVYKYNPFFRNRNFVNEKPIKGIIFKIPLSNKLHFLLPKNEKEKFLIFKDMFKYKEGKLQCSFSSDKLKNTQIEYYDFDIVLGIRKIYQMIKIKSSRKKLLGNSLIEKYPKSFTETKIKNMSENYLWFSLDVDEFWIFKYLEEYKKINLNIHDIGSLNSIKIELTLYNRKGE